MKQYDYTFPSGHSAFMAAIWIAYYFMSKETGLCFHYHWWLHVLLGIATLCTGFSRIYLSLHWPRGELCHSSLPTIEPSSTMPPQACEPA